MEGGGNIVIVIDSYFVLLQFNSLKKILIFYQKKFYFFFKIYFFVHSITHSKVFKEFSDELVFLDMAAVTDVAKLNNPSLIVNAF